MGIGGVGASAKRRGESSPAESRPQLDGFSTTISRAILAAVAIGLIYLFLDQSHLSNHISSSSSSSSTFHVFKSDHLPPQENDDGNKLESILKKASMKDEKTVIITTVNAAWMQPHSIFDLFLESMKIGNHTQQLLHNLVVVALDQDAYSRCSALQHLHCFSLTTDGVDFSGYAQFMSSDYLKMMWRRIDFLRSVLEMGYSFIFSDADVAWLRNPFERLYEDGDFQIACDVYLHNSTSRRNYPNGGFVYVNSNHRSIQFYRYWYAKREAFPGLHDQDVLNKIKFDSFIDEIGLDIRFLDTAYFGGFCQPTQDMDVVVTMHANCCARLQRKIHDLKLVIDDWKKYRKSLSFRSWTVPRLCGLKKSNA